MRRFLMPRTRVWWLVICCALAAVGVFMVFEVLDLEGSDLHKRIFQPPLSSQPTLAEMEGALRHGAFAVRDALGILQQRFAVSYFFSAITPPNQGKRFTSNRPRSRIRRVAFPHLPQPMSLTKDPWSRLLRFLDPLESAERSF